VLAFITGKFDMTTLIPSFGLNSTSLKGPVPIGWLRISRGDTWQGRRLTSRKPTAR
jgi:hypothetical protein